MPSSPSNDIASFHEHLQRSKRVLAVLGAGLSASSGLPTFRGKGGLWRTHDAMSLATPEAFEANPGFSWQFYSYRRHMALKVKPNPAHYALAEYARRVPGFVALSQNVDGLCQRADHPSDQLLLLHGSLFDVKCTEWECGYHGPDFNDPIVPALAIPTDGHDPTATAAGDDLTGTTKTAKQMTELDISDATVPIPHLEHSDLPPCPKCKENLLRPGVVWFGEMLPEGVLATVDNLIADPEGVDLMLVIGTSSTVYPAAGYAFEAKQAGAKVCVVNLEPATSSKSSIIDWYFEGDAAKLVPELLKPVIGELQIPTI